MMYDTPGRRSRPTSWRRPAPTATRPIVGFSMGGGEVARYMSRHGGKGVIAAALISSVVPYMLKTDGQSRWRAAIEVFDQIKPTASGPGPRPLLPPHLHAAILTGSGIAVEAGEPGTMSSIMVDRAPRCGPRPEGDARLCRRVRRNRFPRRPPRLPGADARSSTAPPTRRCRSTPRAAPAARKGISGRATGGI